MAVDSVGAGVGEKVFFVRGKEASFPFYPAEPPVDAGIVGIVDHWDLGGLCPVRLRSPESHADSKVVGTVVSTQKNPKLEGAKLLLVQPMTPTDSRAARRCWRSTASAPGSARRCWS